MINEHESFVIELQRFESEVDRGVGEHWRAARALAAKGHTVERVAILTRGLFTRSALETPCLGTPKETDSH